MSEVNVVTQLDRWITELARKYERFFAHDPQTRVPPEREREALQRRLREISQAEPRTVAEQFKLEQVLHRFSVFNQLWQRMLREREEGITGVASRPEPAPAAGVATNRGPNTGAPANVGDSEGEYRRLYSSYRAALEQTGRAANVAFERFRTALDQQRRAAEEKGAVVEGFEVVQDDSGVKLRARLRRGKQG